MRGHCPWLLSCPLRSPRFTMPSSAAVLLRTRRPTALRCPRRRLTTSQLLDPEAVDLVRMDADERITEPGARDQPRQCRRSRPVHGPRASGASTGRSMPGHLQLSPPTGWLERLCISSSSPHAGHRHQWCQVPVVPERRWYDMGLAILPRCGNTAQSLAGEVLDLSCGQLRHVHFNLGGGANTPPSWPMLPGVTDGTV